MQGLSQWPLWFARVSAGLVLVTGLSVLLGWALDVAALKSVVMGGVAMRANAAFCFVLLGVALLLRTADKAGPRLSPAGRTAELAGLAASICAGLAAAVGLLTLCEYAFGWDLGIDQLLFKQPLDSMTVAAAGRMAPAAAFNFFILGCALLQAPKRLSLGLFQALAISGALIGWLGFSHYLYGGEPLLPFAQLAVHAGIAFGVLSAGVLCLRMDGGLMALLVSESAGGTIARRFVPAALFFPVVFAWLRAEGQRLGWFGADAGLSLFALANVLLFGGLGWASAALLDRIDRERSGAQRARRESQQLLQALADNLTAIIWVKDLEGRYLLINGAYKKLLDLGRENIIGKSDYDLFPKEQADNFRTVDKRAVAAGAPLQAEETVFFGEGAITFLSMKCALLDVTGKPYALCGISTDITDRKRSEEALVAERTLLRTLIDALPDIVFTKDTAGRFTMCNAAELSHLGFQREEQLVGRSVFDLYPRALADAFHADDLQVLSGQPLFGREELTADSQGRQYWVLTTKVPLRNRERQIIGLVGISRDISTIRAAQESLRESHARYQTLAESLPQLVWTCRPDGWCDYLSRQWVEYTGRPAQEQLGYGWAEHLHPDDRAPTQAAWAAATERGDQFDTEFRIRRSDGVYRWFKTRAVPRRDTSGSIVQWFGSNTDIEEYKQAGRRLQTQLERLNLLDRITRAIGERQDLHSIFQAAIRSLEQELPADFCCVCLYEPADHALVVASVGVRSSALAMELAMAEQARIDIDENGLSRCVRGELVHEPDIKSIGFPFAQRLARGGLGALVAAPLQSESRVVGVLVVARRESHSFSSGDCEFIGQLTAHVGLAARHVQLHLALQQAYDDLRQSQQTVLQQERLRALGQMASGIAHDINNAISPVAIYTESLLEHERNLSERGREHLATIARAIDDVASTVTHMREFYRQREPQLALLPVQLNALIPQVIELTRARWSDMPLQRGVVIKVETELAPDLPNVMGVESEVREALTNLIFNAVDAMPDGGALVIRTRATAAGDRGPRYVSVEVIDSGVGMDDETRRRCLEPFYTTKGERGTGLGLAMVYGMTQRHGADIEIESAAGRGTTVRLRFPVPAAKAETSVAPTSLEVPTSRLRILLVDDDPLMLKSLREALELDGHAVVAASGGQAGIDAFVSPDGNVAVFDAVITDLGMPYVDGRKVASTIKSVASSTPVILLTGWGQRLTAEGEVPPHVDLVLNKPPKMREVRAALAQFEFRAGRTRFPSAPTA
jgi:PAS domain S-box-containing protein